MKPINLTVISHSCVLPANQKVWVRVAALDPDINLRLIAPHRWKSSLHGPVQFAALPELCDQADGIRAYCPGNLHLHTYSDLGPAMTVAVPDVLFLDEDPHSLVAWQVLGLQAIMSFQTVITLKQNVPKRHPVPFSLIERAIFRSTSAAAATSQECLEAARQKHYRQPAEIVHYPIDVETLQPGAGDERRNGVVRVGYAGRLVAEKGVEDLLQAAARVPSDVQVVIAGTGPEERRLKGLAESLRKLEGRVRWETVPHEQMPAWYCGLDMLVLPSRTTPRWKEQFGRVAAEAMACGVPVIGSNSGFIPELIESTGGGALFPEGDVGALAAEIGKLAADAALRRQLGEQGRQQVVELYSVEAVARKLVGLIRSVPA